MKKYRKYEYHLNVDRHLSEEMESLTRDAIFYKCSILEDYYLSHFPPMKGDKILPYLRFLRENVVRWKMEYSEWHDVWKKEVKPYILDNFTEDETWTKSSKKGFGNLYDCLHYVAKYLDLHNE